MIAAKATPSAARSPARPRGDAASQRGDRAQFDPAETPAPNAASRVLPPRAEMLRAMQTRDASYAGVFVIAVRTTSIFCRIGCPARRPRPENIEFFESPRAALLAGYRACKRCRPMDDGGAPPAWVARLMQRIERDPHARIRDADLRAAGVDPARARRHFLEHYGMTFQAYHRSRRLGLALAEVRRGNELNGVGQRHGFDSASGFREAFERVFGKPPGRARGSDCVRVSWLASPLGPLLAGATADGVCLLEFTDRRALETQIDVLRQRSKLPYVPGGSPHLEQLEAEIGEYFEGARRAFRTPIVMLGTPFQQKVWRGLLEIPYAATRSYAQLARAVGAPGGSRAVGRANGDNRIAIVIPCHRVIGADGRLTGYGGGLWRKQFLLDLERRAGGAIGDDLFDAT